jgi:hypothetical protein
VYWFKIKIVLEQDVKQKGKFKERENFPRSERKFSTKIFERRENLGPHPIIFKGFSYTKNVKERKIFSLLILSIHYVDSRESLL